MHPIEMENCSKKFWSQSFIEITTTVTFLSFSLRKTNIFHGQTSHSIHLPTNAVCLFAGSIRELTGENPVGTQMTVEIITVMLMIITTVIRVIICR